jgi:YHS domain-containing protein
MKHFITILLISISSTLFAQSNSSERVKQYNLEQQLAIQGYDPVAYFTQSKATKGSPKINLSHLGVIYYFSSEANKKLFEANPQKYEPQYGGWCAYAMGSNAEKVEIDPKTFKILDGKLYLFYNAYWNNTLKSWNKDEKNLKIKADRNWLKFIN